jgi:hypothetical protein
MIKILESLKNTVNKYMADLRPNRLTTYQSERKLAVSRQPGVCVCVCVCLYIYIYICVYVCVCVRLESCQR